MSVYVSLMMWKGCLSWKVYISSKCTRVGIKSFKLCSAKSSYVWNFIIYIGQDAIFDESLKNEPYVSKAVLQVMAPLLNQGYHVIMDDWISTPDLFHKLCSKQTEAMRILRQNRKGVPA
jgi:hypothetical protein